MTAAQKMQEMRSTNVWLLLSPEKATCCVSAAVQVLRRIREEIEVRRAAGQTLPAPPKTAIAGPEYFGFNQPEVRHGFATSLHTFRMH